MFEDNKQNLILGLIFILLGVLCLSAWQIDNVRTENKKTENALKAIQESLVVKVITPEGQKNFTISEALNAIDSNNRVFAFGDEKTKTPGLAQVIINECRTAKNNP